MRQSESSGNHVDVLVIGAGQAGLSAGYHLQRRGLAPWSAEGPHSYQSQGQHTFVILDAEERPGGAWQHRWESLKMATVNGIHELPGYPVPPADPASSSRTVLPQYFSDYEKRFDLRVRRPHKVKSVHKTGDSFEVRTADAVWNARYVINATGTWTRPYWPHYLGREAFQGRQLHTRDYVSAEEFRGQRVVIVGSGISATQLLEEISRVTDTFWVSRTDHPWKDKFSEPEIIASLAEVEERARAGLPPQSIVRVTGMHRTAWTKAAEERGVLVRNPMFERIEANGMRMPDGGFEAADVILWATGFRAELTHLSPLHLRTAEGGVRVANGRSLDEPRLFIIGYGPSQSTVGANRAGRDAVRAIFNEGL